MSARLLILGEPKSGKTGSLASLANSGRILRYINFDNNIDPLRLYTQPEFRKNIKEVKCFDVIRTTTETGKGGAETKSRLAEFRSWPIMCEAMEVWPGDNSNPQDWDNNNILIFDSLSSIAWAQWRAFNAFATDKRKHIQLNYKSVQDIIYNFFVMIRDTIKCPVIVLAHTKMRGADLFVDEDIEDTKIKEAVLQRKLDEAALIDPFIGPLSLGKAQTDVLPSIFSGVIRIEASDFGRVIKTVPKGGYILGVPAPGIPEELSIEDGLMRIFDAWAPKPKIKPLNPGPAAPSNGLENPNSANKE